MRLLVPVALLLATAACAADRAHLSSRNRCDATKAAGFVGQTADEALIEKARRATGADTVRVVPPDTIVTTEYRFGRLTLDVDRNRAVTRAACG